MEAVPQVTPETPENTRSTRPEPATDRPRGDRYIRVAAVAVVIILAGVAAYVSYHHQYGLAVKNGEPAETARWFPIVIDGVIVMASLVMLYCARLKLAVPRLAYLALWAGIGATLAANAAHGWAGGWTARLVSAAPAAVLVIAYELLMWLIRTMRTEAPEPVVEKVVYRDRPVEVEVVRTERVLPRDRYDGARWTYEESLQPGGRRVGRRSLASQWGITEVEARQIQDEVDGERNPNAAPIVTTQLDVPHPEPILTVNGSTGTGGTS